MAALQLAQLSGALLYLAAPMPKHLSPSGILGNENAALMLSPARKFPQLAFSRS
jgi:hypothetical protein